MSEIHALSEFIVSLDYDKIPKDVLLSAQRSVLDTVSCGIGASQMPLIKNINKVFGHESEHGGVSVWGCEEKMSPIIAAFLNAMSSHLLELDDVHTKSKTHIGTVIIPAAYSMAIQNKISGKDFLCAVICGYETAARVGMAFNVVEHRERGWHSTATAGVFGAAAACAKLLNLDADKTIFALGMAGMQAGGVWAFLEDGSSCKVLNPARASVSGYTAALLAYSGMTGPVHILTAKDGGLLKAMSNGGNPALVNSGLGTTWEILSMDNKPYPCCRSTHPCIDAAIHIFEEHHLPLEDIDCIEVETYGIGKKQCGETYSSLHPVNPVEAKFSIPYTVVTAMRKGNVGLADFTQEQVSNKDVQELLQRVKVKESEYYTKSYPLHWGAKVVVYSKSKGCITYEVSDPLGSTFNPLNQNQVIKKGRDLISTVYNTEKTEMIIKTCSEIGTQNIMPEF